MARFTLLVSLREVVILVLSILPRIHMSLLSLEYAVVFPTSVILLISSARSKCACKRSDMGALVLLWLCALAFSFYSSPIT